MSEEWFPTIAGFTCDGYSNDVRLTYLDKLALFEKQVHLAHRLALKR